MDRYTTLLYTIPSFQSGMARTLDVGATFDSYNTLSTPEKADRVALASDWYAVGADLLHSINRFKAKLKGRGKDGRS